MIKWNITSLGALGAVILNINHSFSSTVFKSLEISENLLSTRNVATQCSNSPSLLRNQHLDCFDQTITDLDKRIIDILTPLKYDDRHAESAIAVLKGNDITTLIQKHLDKFYQEHSLQGSVRILTDIFDKKNPEEQKDELLKELNLTIRHTRGQRLSNGFQQHKEVKAEIATLKEQNGILTDQVKDLETKLQNLKESIKNSDDLSLKIECDVF